MHGSLTLGSPRTTFCQHPFVQNMLGTLVIKRRSSFPLKYFSFFVGRIFFRPKKFRPICFFGRKIFARIFSWGGLGGRSRSNHFKKFAKANFLKWCRGGVWGGLPPQESPLPVPCPPGGVWGASPPQESPLPVPCPRRSTYGR